MKYLFFDTETSGLPGNPKIPHTNSDNWPRLVSIAWTICDENKNVEVFEKFIIKPNGWEISQSAIDVHHITNEFAKENGIDLHIVLEKFIRDFSKVDYVIGHNVRFDRKVIAAELYRVFPTVSYHEIFYGMHYRDTMHVSREFCKVPYKTEPGKRPKSGFKFPTLTEMYNKLFEDGKYFEAHDAGNDLKMTILCYWRLHALGLVDRFYETHRDQSENFL